MSGSQSDDPGNPKYWRQLFGEAAEPFTADLREPTSIETLRQLHQHVLENYDFACAATGVKFLPGVQPWALRDDVLVVPIKSPMAGGPLHVSNYLCLSRAAADAFSLGHLAVGPHLELIVDLSRIDPELVERLNADGRLREPQEKARPDPESLSFHRAEIFLASP
ncbi:hypothetical protein VW29_06310 [Devosia limi DSM 17137]|uniref:Uncharacterized protein n=1 Tax=Devosia limi DSM 17137 TaxID=1121477 RepID=A0A0F5LTR1_9HYPH|nr:hypothetical protein [Devosia limi]KKB85676.1 hypothetical protein VW29_06310 [Devosia limi DSM 17137]SHE43598.1 hypothetical protein SAMN02745223_00371 [Devosia limi DSM 17137]